MKKFEWFKFMIWIIVFFILLLLSFMAAWAEDEGTLPNGIFWQGLAQVFSLLRFPTHTLFWPWISKGSEALFYTTLLFNCIFYAVIAERSGSIFRKKT